MCYNGGVGAERGGNLLTTKTLVDLERRMTRRTFTEKFGEYWAKWWMSFTELEDLDCFEGRVSVLFCRRSNCPVFGGESDLDKKCIQQSHCVKTNEDLFVPFVSYAKDKERRLDKDCYPVNVGLWNLALPGSTYHLFPDHKNEEFLVEYEEHVGRAFDNSLGISNLPISQWDDKVKSHLVLGFAFLLEDAQSVGHNRIAICALELTHDEMERLKKSWRDRGVRMPLGQTVANELKSTFGRLHENGGWGEHLMDRFFKHYVSYQNELIRKGYACMVVCTLTDKKETKGGELCAI